MLEHIYSTIVACMYAYTALYVSNAIMLVFMYVCVCMYVFIYVCICVIIRIMHVCIMYVCCVGGITPREGWLIVNSQVRSRIHIQITSSI